MNKVTLVLLKKKKIIIIIIKYLTKVNPSAEAVRKGCPRQLKINN